MPALSAASRAAKWLPSASWISTGWSVCNVATSAQVILISPAYGVLKINVAASLRITLPVIRSPLRNVTVSASPVDAAPAVARTATTNRSRVKWVERMSISTHSERECSPTADGGVIRT
jgi:hypothetical protein